MHSTAVPQPLRKLSEPDLRASKGRYQLPAFGDHEVPGPDEADLVVVVVRLGLRQVPVDLGPVSGAAGLG